MVDVLEIVKRYLLDNGYDGLYYPGECSCDVDDLAPCGGDLNSVADCRPGHRVPCQCGEGCEYDIGEAITTPEEFNAMREAIFCGRCAGDGVYLDPCQPGSFKVERQCPECGGTGRRREGGDDE